jgi:putative polymerase
MIRPVVPAVPAVNEDDARDRRHGWWVLGLVMAAMSFNFVLCFMHTNVAQTSTVHVMGCEFIILLLTFLTAFPATTLHGVYLVIILTLYLACFALLRGVNNFGAVDIKIVRDFLIPFAFFWLGKTTRLHDADRIVRWCVVLALAVGLFENFFLSTFLKYFNIIEYYISRGTVPDGEAAHLSAGGLMVSGIRPEGQGRQLLPWLLDGHRISSVFLGPSSLGNFGIIVTLWAAIRSRMEGTVWWKLALAGIACIVLADTRFAATFLVIGILVILLPPLYGTALTAAIPFVAVFFLLFVITPADLASNDTSGRLAYASLVLTEFSFANWMGFTDSALQTFDAGYGYLFSGIGFIGVLALWACFMSLRGPTSYFYQLRNAIGAYLAILFLISQSQMTIKTAGLLWLLLGVMSVVRSSDLLNLRADRLRFSEDPLAVQGSRGFSIRNGYRSDHTGG